jgi:DNA-binding FrmR family transcriptional regulator
LRFALLILTSAVGIAGAGYGLVSSRVDDRCETINAQINAVRADVARDALRIDHEEESTAEMRDRLARIETKLDTILERMR